MLAVEISISCQNEQIRGLVAAVGRVSHSIAEKTSNRDTRTTVMHATSLPSCHHIATRRRA